MSQLRLAGVRAAAAAAAAAGSSSCAAALPLCHLGGRCRRVHSRAPVRVAAVFGGEDAFASPSAAAAAPSASGGAERSRLSSLFAGLPLPMPSGAGAARQGLTMPPAPPQRRLPLSHPPPLEASLPAAALAAAQAQANQAAAAHPGAATAAATAGSLAPPAPAAAVASAASGVVSPTLSSAAAVQSSRAAAAATTAQVAITYITPRFLVFMRARSAEERAIAAQNGEEVDGEVTAQSVLRQATRHGLDWTDGHGIAARHVMVVSSSSSSSGAIDLSALAGFPCTHAFYLTFPRHETRSIARMRFLEHAVAGSGAAAERKLDELGWRMVRYPTQLLLGGVPAAPAHRQGKGPVGGRGGAAGGPFSSPAASGKLEPRALLSMARSAGLPGWDVLDESFFEPHKPAGSRGLFGMVRVRTRFDYTVKVPPLPRYLNAVAAIAASSARVEEQLGWLIRPGTVGEEDDAPVAGAPPAAADGVPLVPVIPFNPKLHSAPAQSSSAQSATPAATAAAASSTNAAAAAEHATDMPAFVEVKSPPLPPPVADPSPSPASPSASRPAGERGPKAPRFYFYRMDERGRVWLDEEQRAHQSAPALLGGLRTPSGTAGSVLRDVKALNMLLRNLRPSAALIASDPLLRPFMRSKQSVPIPPGSVLAPAAAAAAAAAGAAPDAVPSLPLSSIPAAYPWASVCAGEFNFLRCEVVPVVFHALQQRAKRTAPPAATAAGAAVPAAPAQPVMEHVLVYGGDCTHPFNPAALFVDTTGRLFHPAPVSADDSATAAAAAPASPSSSSSPSGLVAPSASSLGLLDSRLALDLSLSEAQFTRGEIDFCIRQQEETRRLTIALQEEFQRRREAGDAEVQGARPDVWIGAGVRLGLQRAGLSRGLSRFVCHWLGKTHRIGIVDEEVAPSVIAPTEDAAVAEAEGAGVWRQSRPSAR